MSNTKVKFGKITGLPILWEGTWGNKKFEVTEDLLVHLSDMFRKYKNQWNVKLRLDHDPEGNELSGPSYGDVIDLYIGYTNLPDDKGVVSRRKALLMNADNIPPKLCEEIKTLQWEHRSPFIAPIPERPWVDSQDVKKSMIKSVALLGVSPPALPGPRTSDYFLFSDGGILASEEASFQYYPECTVMLSDEYEEEEETSTKEVSKHILYQEDAYITYQNQTTQKSIKLHQAIDIAESDCLADVLVTIQGEMAEKLHNDEICAIFSDIIKNTVISFMHNLNKRNEEYEDIIMSQENTESKVAEVKSTVLSETSLQERQLESVNKELHEQLEHVLSDQKTKEEELRILREKLSLMEHNEAKREIRNKIYGLKNQGRLNVPAQEYLLQDSVIDCLARLSAKEEEYTVVLSDEGELKGDVSLVDLLLELVKVTQPPVIENVEEAAEAKLSDEHAAVQEPVVHITLSDAAKVFKERNPKLTDSEAEMRAKMLMRAVEEGGTILLGEDNAIDISNFR